ncbi:DUF2125 domain-containing protein [Pseudaestuariivita rosea]|uniref:DUF2125 domain-containing protein n=1 Tax=Pseudaestuariivita rosea TaxID=2763263 RepID=UPI001ABA0990|nr:DUF2125 domain-containing protein [Pseudaestuariivita rosea]
MRGAIRIFIIVAVLYGGYWFVVSTAIEQGANTWLEDRRTEGWVADADVQTTGFPLSFNTMLENIQLADPETGLAWTAPSFQFQAQSYTPSYIDVVFADRQSLASPYETLDLQSEVMQASVGFQPGPSLTLDLSSVSVRNMQIRSSQGWQSRFAVGDFTTAQAEAVPDAHDIKAELTELVLDRQLKRRLDPAGLLPDDIQMMQVDMTAGFDKPWDRFAVEQARPQPTFFDVELIRANWGDLELRATGRVDIDDQGVPDGRIHIKAENWREILGVAVQAGFVPQDILPTIENALQILAGLSGNPNSLDVPMTFQNGTMFFGPIPLGPAPVIRLR